MSRAFKVGVAAGYDIPYLNFSTGVPVLGSVSLPTNYFGFRGGCYCHSNNSVYLQMGNEDNGADAYCLKIADNQTTSQVTLGGNVANNKVLYLTYTGANRIIYTINNIVYVYNPETNTVDYSFTGSGNLNVLLDDTNTIRWFGSSGSHTVYKLPIEIQNKDIYDPIFNYSR